MLENLAQEVLEAQRDEPVPVVVVLLEYVRHALQRDAALDKQIEAHGALLALVVGAEKKLDEIRAEAVAERGEGIAELAERDIAASVDVEAVKEGAPRGEKRPQAAELLETNGSTPV